MRRGKMVYMEARINLVGGKPVEIPAGWVRVITCK
jgi:hypothetical protein